MKLIKTVGVGTFLLATILSAPLLFGRSASADSYIDGTGATQQVSSGSGANSFYFTDPYTIKAKASSTVYKTASTACSNDNIYNCSDGYPFYPGSYWYWPDGNVLGKAANGQCVSGLLLSIRHQPAVLSGSNSALKYSRLYLVRATTSSIDGHCYVKDQNGDEVAKQDVTGWGEPATDDTWIGGHTTGFTSTTTAGVGGPDSFVDPSSRTGISSGDDYNSSYPLFRNLATEFTWTDSETISAMVSGRASKKVVPGSGAFTSIQSKLPNALKNGYSYFYPSECLQNDTVMAVLAVKDGSPDQVVIAHRDGGDKSKNFVYQNWDGDAQQCLIGHNHTNSPATMYGGGDGDTTLMLANVENATAAVGSGSGAGLASDVGNGDGSDASDSSTGCDFGGNPLTWIICPVVGAAEQFINRVDSFITDSLDFKTDTVFSDGSAYYTAWNSFRILATALLIIGGLVMVSSQAFGFEFLDAYTIRKVLPRLIVAIIGISLSWPLMQFVITFFNTLGYDIRAIMYAPFKDIAAGNTLGGSVLAVGNGALLATIIALGVGGALSLLLTAALAILVGFFIIVVRDLALTVIIVLAPVAIACYILPNTQKVWKLWSDNFLGLLLVFPIISAFIAAGRIFSAVSLSQGAGNGVTGGGTATQIVGFVAYFLPYFLLPIAFRLATGVVGTIAGFVNDRGRGAFDRLKKYRGNTIAKNMHDLKAGSRYNPDSTLTKVLGGRAVNRVGSHVGSGVRGRYGFGATGAAARANNAFATSDSLAKENSAFAAQMNNEDAMIAVALGNDRRKLEQLTWFRNPNGSVNKQKVDAALAAGRSVGSDQRTQVAALDAVAKSGKVINSRQELNTVLDSVSHGNASMRGGLKGQYQFTSRQSGRNDIGRDTAHESIRELDMSTVGRLKPTAAANLFGTDPATGRSEFHDAVRSAASPAERQHMYDVLYSAQYNPYMSPEQQAQVAQTIGSVSGDPFWAQAAINYGAKMAGGRTSTTTTPGAPPGGPPPGGGPGTSDQRLKRSIQAVGETEDGITLYRFKYLWSEVEYVGVMAQDLIYSHPQVLVMDEEGFYRVHYKMLGLQMITYAEWQKNPNSIYSHKLIDIR